jgi:hypothetical protein
LTYIDGKKMHISLILFILIYTCFFIIHDANLYVHVENVLPIMRTDCPVSRDWDSEVLYKYLLTLIQFIPVALG